MDTDRLRYFCTIFETGSLTKAALLLGISHSALSKAMSVLQDELQVELFRPVGRGIEPTERAKDVYVQSKEILAKVSALKDPVPGERTLTRIGLTELLGLCVVGQVSKVVSENISFHSLSSGEIETAILNKEIDFGFSLIPFPKKELEYLRIAKMKFGVFKRAGFLNRQSPEDLPFVVPTTGVKDNPLTIKSRDIWPLEIDRKVSFGSSSVAHALEIALQGRACIFIPQVLAQELNRRSVKSFELEEITHHWKIAAKNLSLDLLLVKHTHAEESSMMKKVSKELRRLFNGDL